MKQQTILCWTAQMDAQWMGTVRFWQLETYNITQMWVDSYEDRNTLIEKSALAQTTLIEHSLP